jgi:hypothetical protein
MNPIILLGGGVFVLFLLIIGVIVSITSERSLVEERLGRFLEDDRPQGEKDEGGSIAGRQNHPWGIALRASWRGQT